MKKTIVCIITGPCGAGKSTLARYLAKGTKRSVHIDVDHLRDMIKNGCANPTIYTGESKKQVDLATKNTCDLANNFLKNRFNVFIDDILERKQQVIDYTKGLKNYNLHIFLLLPNKEVLAKRDIGRNKENVMGKRALELHDIFTKRMPEERWHVLDTSNHSLEQTKKEIIKIIQK
tara:strand:+ start:1076 stop:1600 length:525 start_codon:yes stop_codon:yes gene_type:complete